MRFFACLTATIVFFASSLDCKAYDSLYISLRQADSIFLKENLLLLSQTYAIGAKDALIIQARAYPNPVFSAQLNAIDPQHDRYFNIGPSGQKEFNLEQLLLLGGKRKSTISIARQSKAIAENELAELLRNLKLQLHTSFYLLSKDHIILVSYRQQLELLDELINSYEEQTRKGNLPVKDVIRLKSVRLRISSNRNEVTAAYLEEIRKLQVLLHTAAQPIPVINENVFLEFQRPHEFEELFDSAQNRRPDFEVARQERALAATTLKLQKQMAVPDVVLNSGYDQTGGAFKNQIQVGLSVPLPLWNRNRGNVKAAAYDELNATLLIEQKRTEIRAEVVNAAEEMKTAIAEYAKASQLYTNDFNDVFRGINENFSKRNISILEFVDFFEAYNESLADFQRIKTQLALLAEQINYVTASPIY